MAKTLLDDSNLQHWNNWYEKTRQVRAVPLPIQGRVVQKGGVVRGTPLYHVIDDKSGETSLVDSWEKTNWFRRVRDDHPFLCWDLRGEEFVRVASLATLGEVEIEVEPVVNFMEELPARRPSRYQANIGQGALRLVFDSMAHRGVDNEPLPIEEALLLGDRLSLTVGRLRCFQSATDGLQVIAVEKEGDKLSIRLRAIQGPYAPQYYLLQRHDGSQKIFCGEPELYLLHKDP